MCYKVVWNCTSNDTQNIQSSPSSIVCCYWMISLARGVETHTTSKVQNFQGNQKISTSVIKIINSKITRSHIDSTHTYRETTRINDQKNIWLNEGKEKNMLQAHAKITTNMVVTTLKVLILEEVIIMALFSMLKTHCLNTQMNIQTMTTWRTTKVEGPPSMKSLWWNLWISFECHDFSNCYDFYDKFGPLNLSMHLLKHNKTTMHM